MATYQRRETACWGGGSRGLGGSALQNPEKPQEVEVQVP